ncbi:MAG TPA: hypothetical protein PLN63_04280 [Paludibacteraceae bacterium]|nr:hypothetical protein [Paludibacteraceae bacterium]HOU68171.1 hypothetical protein [Paludibacteraceae bacterium]HPH62818.1 hypothetical protein [Paludibacteraceae bacterium]HQF50066.1 hypothetical protein [Paludibacteraceae bacterium]HQJ89289.1 hypothetical protein [Paludibacteraceae bacterium]
MNYLAAKKKYILLVTVFVALFVFVLFPKNGKDEIHRLTSELAQKTDSLKSLNRRYDSLLSEYEKVEHSLLLTEMHVKECKLAVDSLSKCRKKSLDVVLTLLQDLLNTKDTFSYQKKADNDLKF